MRSFVAIPLPPEVRTRVESAARSLEELGVSGRGVRAGAIHLTLKFLGELGQDQVRETGDRLRRLATGVAPFELVLDGPGAFPSTRSPRVVFVSVQTCPGLLRLQELIAERLAEIGEREARAYRPHLTLMRLRSRRHLARLHGWFEEGLAVSGVSFPVDRFNLFQSILQPGGAEYRVLETFRLGE